MTRIIAGLGEIADRYDVLLSDVWGVIHNGREAFATPCAVLAKWRRERGPVILISNSPRPASDVVNQLDAMGVSRDVWTAFVTSGDATRVLLAARAPGPAWRIGPDRDAPLYEGLGLDFSGPDAARFIACTGPNHDEIETPEDYRATLTYAAERGLEMICANPDLMVQRGDRLIYCGGALASLYEALGGRAIMAGKPHAPIYDLALDEAQRAFGSALDRRRVLAIGDGLATDVAGAADQGLDSLFIATGIHGQDFLGSAGDVDAGALDRLRVAGGSFPAFAMPDLDW
jgi:HAD superfamily hydrolase (TIGR01459 family)